MEYYGYKRGFVDLGAFSEVDTRRSGKLLMSNSSSEYVLKTRLPDT